MASGKPGLALTKPMQQRVFTANLVRAPPVILMEERIWKGYLGAVIVNSGCANAYTGKQGYHDAIRMGEIAGRKLGIDPEHIGVASTGVIGRYLDLPLIEDQCNRIAPLMEHSTLAETLAARAIMTTDLTEKHALIPGEGFSIGGITKGSGMIAPNMGTMLAFLIPMQTSPRHRSRQCWRQAANRTFNDCRGR